MSETNFDRTAKWIDACLSGAGKDKDQVRFGVQLGCVIEEFVEMLSAVSIESPHVDAERFMVCGQLAHIAKCLKKQYAHVNGVDDCLLIDSIADIKVTVDALAHIANYDQNGADTAVLSANDAKLVNGKPVILDGGKIGKPTGWTAPDMRPYVKNSIFGNSNE